jgi:hypothetical protein
VSVIKISLNQLEARLQSLVEGSAARLFPGGYLPRNLAGQLVDAMRDGTQPGEDGVPQAPNLFTLLAAPDQAPALQSNQFLIEELTRALREAGQDSGLRFCAPPVVRVAVDPSLGPNEIQVLAQNSLEDISQTSDVATEQNENGRAIPANAFLIVDGTQVFPLGKTVVNIGRRPDNQLAIDDARISRLHAQLRAIRGHYVIFDLDSKGGTWVNGQRVRQHTLFPGDVISLAGVPLVFGQDAPDPGETQEFVPSP